jgi:hypothetical protein
MWWCGGPSCKDKPAVGQKGEAEGGMRQLPFALPPDGALRMPATLNGNKSKVCVGENKRKKDGK